MLIRITSGWVGGRGLRFLQVRVCIFAALVSVVNIFLFENETEVFCIVFAILLP